MKDDVRTKTGAPFPRGSKLAKRQLARLLELTSELDTVYHTYPGLRALVGRNAWRSLGDTVYMQLMHLNLNREDHVLVREIEQNFNRLEDIASAALFRDDTGLRELVSRVLIFRLQNGLVREEA